MMITVAIGMLVIVLGLLAIAKFAEKTSPNPVPVRVRNQEKHIRK